MVSDNPNVSLDIDASSPISLAVVPPLFASSLYLVDFS